MTIKQIRILLAASALLVLCGGCVGGCSGDDFSDRFRGGLSFSRSSYGYVVEGDGGPIDAFGDAGPSDAFGDAGVE